MEHGKLPQDELEKFPEEFREKVNNIAFNLEKTYTSTYAEVYSKLQKLLKESSNHENPRKFLGLKGKGQEHFGILFSFYDGNVNAIDKYIMQNIRPKCNEIIL